MKLETPTASRCPRCGVLIPPDADLVERQLEAIALIRSRAWALPDVAMANLRDVAAALRCRAGRCGAAPPVASGANPKLRSP